MMDEQMVKEQENPKTHEDAVTGPPEREKAYSLRRLNATDVFLMVRILGKIRINEWIPCLQSPRVMELIRKIMETEEQDGEKAVQAEESGETAEEKLSNEEFIAGIGVAMEVVNILLQHLPECRAEIFQLLSGVSGIGVKEIEALDAEIFINMLVDFVRKEEFLGFIRAAARLVH